MNTARTQLSINRRQMLAMFAATVVSPTLTTACSHPVTEEVQPFPQGPAQIHYYPDNPTQLISPTELVKIEVQDGWFQKIALTSSTGKNIEGTLNFDRTRYTISEPLGYDTVYTWVGSVVGRDGTVTDINRELTTLHPKKIIHGEFQLADGQIVGIAVPVILQFNAPIADKAAVENALHVTTEPPVEGAWAWLPDEARGARVHWRTRHYYPAGTKVHVRAQLYGVEFGEGAYGDQDISLDFSIGRHQIVKAEVSSHRMQVIQNDQIIMDFPCSYGQGDQPRNITRNGIHVVTEKYADFYMTNPPAGYTNIHEQWAVRISNNGEFIHANPASAGAQGNSNVTNGCINLSTQNAESYFHTALYGDPVEVTGSPIELSYADGDIWDWAVDWDAWLAMSAFRQEESPQPLHSEEPPTHNLTHRPSASSTDTISPMPPTTTTSMPTTTPLSPSTPMSSMTDLPTENTSVDE